MSKYSAQDVIKEATKWIGYHEKASNKNLEDFTANSGSANYTIFGKTMHEVYPATMDAHAAWCDAFNDYCHYMASGKDAAEAARVLCGKFDDYTQNSASYYNKKGQFFYRGEGTPKEGDQIFFGTAKKISAINHTGVVYKVTSSMVYTIEGNTSNMVKKKSYSLSNSKIVGYGRPLYGEESGSSATATKTNATSTYSGTFPTLPPRGYFKKGDGYLTLTTAAWATQLKYLQQFLNWFGDYGLAIDGKYGPKTLVAVKRYQKSAGLSQDGYFGKKSLAKAKTCKK